MDIKVLFSKRLKQTRNQKGFTQDRLSELTGINKKMISKYEQGLILPGVDNLQKLVVSLEVSADYLLLPHARMTGVPKVKDPDLYERYFVLETLDPIERNAALVLLNSLVAQQRLREIAKDYTVKP